MNTINNNRNTLNSKRFGEIYKAIAGTNKRLVLLRRWSSDQTDDQYDELAKQEFNMIVAFVLASYEEQDEREIDWSNFPLISLYRCIQKAWLTSDVSEATFREICRIGDLKDETTEEATEEVIISKLGDELGRKVCNSWKSPEQRLFKAASKIATYVEASMLPNIENTKLKELVDELNEYYDIKSVQIISDPDSSIFKLLQKISNLRHQNRWVTFFRGLDCSVLGHMLDTAFYAYLMALEEDPENAVKKFFIGLFHDLPEGWTKDIPSPIKNKITGFRRASEDFELYMIEKNVYNVVEPFLAERLKSVMMEDEENKGFKECMKGADYISASVECLYNLVAGSRDGKFLIAMHDLEENIAKGKAYVTPGLQLFYEELLAEGEKMRPRLCFFFED